MRDAKSDEIILNPKKYFNKNVEYKLESPSPAEIEFASVYEDFLGEGDLYTAYVSETLINFNQNKKEKSGNLSISFGNKILNETDIAKIKEHILKTISNTHNKINITISTKDSSIPISLINKILNGIKVPVDTITLYEVKLNPDTYLALESSQVIIYKNRENQMTKTFNQHTLSKTKKATIYYTKAASHAKTDDLSACRNLKNIDTYDVDAPIEKHFDNKLSKNPRVVILPNEKITYNASSHIKPQQNENTLEQIPEKKQKINPFSLALADPKQEDFFKQQVESTITKPTRITRISPLSLALTDPKKEDIFNHTSRNLDIVEAQKNHDKTIDFSTNRYKNGIHTETKYSAGIKNKALVLSKTTTQTPMQPSNSKAA